MTSGRKTVATWEKSANGLPTLIHSPASLKVRGVLRGLAFAKMEEVSVISARFGGERAIFEPLIQVRIEGHDLVEFMGLYTPAFERESIEPCLPTLCLRRGRWIWSEDSMLFDQADDKATYATSAQHLDSRVTFRAHDVNMAQLIDRAYALFRTGVGLERTDRQDYRWGDLSVRVREDAHSWSVEYTPNANKNLALEAWVADWHAYFTGLDSDQGIVPDGNCPASYELSLADRLRAIGSWQESTKPE